MFFFINTRVSFIFLRAYALIVCDCTMTQTSIFLRSYLRFNLTNSIKLMLAIFWGNTACVYIYSIVFLTLFYTPKYHIPHPRATYKTTIIA